MENFISIGLIFCYSLEFFNVYGALFSVVTHKLDLFRERFKKKEYVKSKRKSIM